MDGWRGVEAEAWINSDGDDGVEEVDPDAGNTGVSKEVRAV